MARKLKNGYFEIFFLSIFIVFILIIFTGIVILKLQINSYVYPLKEDIFYIVQNAIISCNENSLSNFDYVIDENLMKEKVDKILIENYKNAKLVSIKYNKLKNVVYGKIEVEIVPMIFSLNNKCKVGFNYEVKLKMLDVK